jgi:hypothetical protein
VLTVCYLDKSEGSSRGSISQAARKAGLFVNLSDSRPNYGNVLGSLDDPGITAGYDTRAVFSLQSRARGRH